MEKLQEFLKQNKTPSSLQDTMVKQVTTITTQQTTNKQHLKFTIFAGLLPTSWTQNNTSIPNNYKDHQLCSDISSTHRRTIATLGKTKNGMDRSNNKNDQGKYGQFQTETDIRTERHTNFLHPNKKVAMKLESGSYTPARIIEIRL